MTRPTRTGDVIVRPSSTVTGHLPNVYDFVGAENDQLAARLRRCREVGNPQGARRVKTAGVLTPPVGRATPSNAQHAGPSDE
jgi:hypothetical protein